MVFAHGMFAVLGILFLPISVLFGFFVYSTAHDILVDALMPFAFTLRTVRQRHGLPVRLH
jgi:hypothetical protein